jgi:hypothetical protein
MNTPLPAQQSKAMDFIPTQRDARAGLPSESDFLLALLKCHYLCGEIKKKGSLRHLAIIKSKDESHRYPAPFGRPTLV